MEAEVRHHRHCDGVDLEVEREDRDDLIAVDGLAVLVDREHAVAVAVEGDAEVEAAVAHGLLQQREVGRAAADVDVVAVGRIADRVHLRAALLECLRCEPGVRAVRAVDHDAQPAQIGAEPLEDVLQVGVGRDLDVLDASLVDAGRRSEQRLDLLLGRVGQLVAMRVEELHAVVLGRVVRRRDDDAEVEREQRDSRGRQDAAEDAVAAGGDDAARRTPLRARRRTHACRVRRRPSPRPVQSAAARPSRSTSSGVRTSPTTPRTPSVPKYLRATRCGAIAC